MVKWKLEPLRSWAAPWVNRARSLRGQPEIRIPMRILLADGVTWAVRAPGMAVLAFAVGDYAGLRKFLLDASQSEITQVLVVVMSAGFCLGVSVVGTLRSAFPEPEPGAASRIGARRDAESSAGWYWNLAGGGQELAIREVTLAHCVPTVRSRWALDDLIKELQRAPHNSGSDLLDRKVARGLAANLSSLKPTQRLDDAVSLLSLRYCGLPSTYEWQAKVEALGNQYRAYVSVRAAVAGPGAEPPPWLRCLTADGPSPVMAVTIAALTRETWTFTT